jgi:hypothetical protein
MVGKINNFDVLKRMGERGDDIRICTTITEMTYNAKRGTEVAIGVPGNVCFEIEQGKLNAFLLLYDKRQFDELKRSMEKMGELGINEQNLARTGKDEQT